MRGNGNEQIYIFRKMQNVHKRDVGIWWESSVDCCRGGTFRVPERNLQDSTWGEDYKHLAEEVADATIMLDKIRLMFNINDCVCNFMDEKIKRLDDRVKGYVKNVKSDWFTNEGKASMQGLYGTFHSMPWQVRKVQRMETATGWSKQAAQGIQRKAVRKVQSLRLLTNWIIIAKIVYTGNYIHYFSV